MHAQIVKSVDHSETFASRLKFFKNAMRKKRAKQYKRLMALYSTSFGFREPYQILLDGNFATTATSYKINLETQLSKVMQGSIKQMYTLCSINELRQSGEKEHSRALQFLSQLEKRGCSHLGSSVSSAECLASIIGNENEHRYCVATQNRKLREKLRGIPGVPLLYINRTVLIFEPPSYVTLEKAKQIEIAKTLPSTDEMNFLKMTNSDAKNKIGAKSKAKKKHKGPKQPNPLSCKKSKKKPSQKIATKNIIEISKNTSETRKRKRENDEKEEYIEQNKDGQSIDSNANGSIGLVNGTEHIIKERKRKRKKKKRKKNEELPQNRSNDVDEEISSSGAESK
ncbi:914_t:CDS:2 [Ambispora gerdemannii]|uniref:U three protein 23 n=1 Tax=Ambispora gerdemannii TaxID=144530 RepID=A0A9N9FX20_9GLOM|nr:914_t:CDS:2 [Ambispora gerdemannii]